MANDWLTGLMLEWAQFMEKAATAGWSSETTLYHAMKGEGHGEFGPRLPPGLEKLTTYGQLRQLCIILKELSERPDARVAEPVRAVKAFYLDGRENAERELDVKSTKFDTLLKIGEGIIAAKLEPPRHITKRNIL